ncbi:sterol desaturase family protein [Arcticibacterium luteifluviistationis]|uniref:Sterol desaturase n=1 Tax=Arcticibacterium luteifluviistationis TaxID=1784714 RepID=A0A2Z4GAH1_9BACT|nr:sterol desaturase family protein [Arcticibacterium luteifluviistationis]AWV98068.1 sterol desaturase [Arcticibacterium luteifluviistationis]
METYAGILLIASPLFFLFVLAERIYGYFAKGDSFKSMDVISSLSSGYTNTLKDVLGIGISLLSYNWMLEHWAFIKIEYTWLNVLIAFMALDLAGYIGHRINHSVNFFWNQHLIHHSSEEFNLACALRQSISSLVGFFTIFLLPAALLGVDFKIIAIVAPLHLFAQFWYHTEYIGKLGFLEKIIVTPSHHRVHHAINPVYLDKNMGQIFIFWDFMFGTFQEELDDVPPVYGITRQVNSWNPIKINFQHFWLMVKDAVRADSWWDAIRIWFMPTGWRPADVEAKYPEPKIEDPYNFEKYYPDVSMGVLTWSWIQFFTTFGFLMYFFMALGRMDVGEMAVYGLFMFFSVYCYTEFMGKNPLAIWQELAKNGLGLYLFVKHDGWFGLESINAGLNYVVMAYFIVATLVTGYFVLTEFREKPDAVPLK